MTTLKEFKFAFFNSTSWRSQRSVNDRVGYERDQRILSDVSKARTWTEIVEAMPGRWYQAALERRIP